MKSLFISKNLFIFFKIISAFLFLTYMPLIRSAVSNVLPLNINSNNRLVEFKTDDRKLEKKYVPRLELHTKIGNFRSIIRPMGLIPLSQTDKSLSYFNLIGMGDTQKNFEGNFALGLRKIFKNSLIFGGYAYFDFRRSSNNNKMKQITVGIEYLEEFFELRSNFYWPLQNKFLLDHSLSATSKFNGANTTFVSYQNEKFEVTNPGIDLEVGGNLPTAPQFSSYMTAFYYHHDTFPKTYGVRFRVAYDINNWLGLDAETTYDNNRKQFVGYLGARLTWQIGKRKLKSALTLLEQKMNQMPIRDIDIVVHEIQRSIPLNIITVPGFSPLLSPLGLPIDGATAFNSIDDINEIALKKNLKIASITEVKPDGTFTSTLSANDPKSMSDQDMRNLGIENTNPAILDPNGVLLASAKDPNDLRNSMIRLRNNVLTYEQTLIQIAREENLRKAQEAAIEEARLSQQALQTQETLNNLLLDNINFQQTVRAAAIREAENIRAEARLEAERIVRESQDNINNQLLRIQQELTDIQNRRLRLVDLQNQLILIAQALANNV